ncbi:hypothetical protein T06_2161 [Trichinella sp. T6]|nr:hypothetical protein T06_2161 [Trichinella sp. T6]
MVLHVHAACEEEGPAKNNRAPMQPMTAGYPLQTTGKDSTRGRYEQVLTDYFTKWTVAFSLTTMEAGAVAKVLVEKYVLYFGTPDYLHSDQCCSFEASGAEYVPLVQHQEVAILFILPAKKIQD